MEKIYISGKISGIPLEYAEPMFRFAKKEVTTYYFYNSAVIPLDLKPFLGLKNWWCHMISDLYALSKCDAIFMLRNWKDSRGACVEHLYAVWTKKTIIYQ